MAEPFPTENYHKGLSTAIPSSFFVLPSPGSLSFFLPPQRLLERRALSWPCGEKMVEFIPRCVSDNTPEHDTSHLRLQAADTFQAFSLSPRLQWRHEQICHRKMGWWEIALPAKDRVCVQPSSNMNDIKCRLHRVCKHTCAKADPCNNNKKKRGGVGFGVMNIHHNPAIRTTSKQSSVDSISKCVCLGLKHFISDLDCNKFH